MPGKAPSANLILAGSQSPIAVVSGARRSASTSAAGRLPQADACCNDEMSFGSTLAAGAIMPSPPQAMKAGVDWDALSAAYPNLTREEQMMVASAASNPAYWNMLMTGWGSRTS